MIATIGGSTLWFLSRATGIVAFVLLTTSVLLGVATSMRIQTRHVPRFVVEHLHRNVTVLVLVLTAIHVASIVLDRFAPIGWAASVVPFSSPYRPIWLSLGALGLDLLLAVAVTSWLRHRIGFRSWRFVHWAAYAAWLGVLVHAFGTGTDTSEGWALLVEGGAAALVIIAVWFRLGQRWDEHTGVRMAALGTTLVVPLVLAVWLVAGPLAPHWSRRSGTPSSVTARIAARVTSR